VIFLDIKLTFRIMAAEGECSSSRIVSFVLLSYVEYTERSSEII